MKTSIAAVLGLVASLAVTDVSLAQCRSRSVYYPPVVYHPIDHHPIVHHRVTHRPVVRVVERVTTPSTTFGSRAHLDNYADLLQKQANSVAWDMYRNYQGNPGFEETYKEVYELLDATKHVHALIHDATYVHGVHDVDHIAQDLHQMDQLFHHIEDDIANWVPTHASYHFARAHGDLHSRVEAMEETLHHLMEDYGVNSNLGDPPPPGPTTLLAPPRP